VIGIAGLRGDGGGGFRLNVLDLLRPDPPGTHRHRGIFYQDFLARLHAALTPRSYLEIGVARGKTLRYARCAVVAVDPELQLRHGLMIERPAAHLVRATSDEFFARYDLRALLPDGVDLAFLDGMHLFEFLLRDIANTERFAQAGSVIALHDCCPINVEMTEREHRADARADRRRRQWWTGDVWKVLPILREYRPDIRLHVLDCPPTGLVLLTRLDPHSRVLPTKHAEIVARFRPQTLADYGFERFRREFPAGDSRAAFPPDALTRLLGRR
jgi:hypothetical protein